MILLLDHRDSFTFNIAQGLAGLGADVRVLRPTGLTLAAVGQLAPEGVVLGPGPGGPAAATLARELVAAADPRTPILGICLGHQALAMAHGARVVRAPRPVHGHAEPIDHDGRSLFHGRPTPLEVGRYHSLTVDPTGLPADLEVSARSRDGCIMGLRHRGLPHEGLQFHPDSLLTPTGNTLFEAWLGQVAARARGTSPT